MPRLRIPRPAALRGARLLIAAGVVLGCVDAMAQTAAPVFPDPLAPKLQTDPRNPPRFQKFEQPALVQLRPPTNFSAPASGAGDTGFDSTNNRKKTKGKAKTKSPANAQAISPGVPAPAVVSPYQKPPADTAGGAFAAAPGTPPVELGPIR